MFYLVSENLNVYSHLLLSKISEKNNAVFLKCRRTDHGKAGITYK